MLRNSVRFTRRLSRYSSQLVKNHIGDGHVGAPLVAWQSQNRLVSSRKGDKFEEPDTLEVDDTPEPIRMNNMVSPDDMEFYDPMAMDDFDEDEEDENDDDLAGAGKEERQKVRDELDSRTGRLWSDPWEITEEDWSKMRTSDDLPDWTPDLCSRVSLERIQIYADGIPTISTLAKIPLPPPPPPHPGHGLTKEYAKARKRKQYDHVAAKVAEAAAPKIDDILKFATWQEKQDAVDQLFEDVEFALKDQEQILSKHPSFGKWVEQALEEHLRTVKPKDEVEGDNIETLTYQEETIEADDHPSAEEDAKALPMFVDLYDEPDLVVPKILHPLKPHHADGPGRMVEEWELSAHKGTKRVLLRQCTRSIAQALDSDTSPVRVYVTGRRGVGKTATLATIVASARHSGSIVLYLPDGDRLRKNGYYVEPSARRPGMFDLPILSQEVCTELLTTHEGDLDGMVAHSDTISKFFDERELKKLPTEFEEEISLVELLQLGRDHTAFAPMCYSTVVHSLMNQTEKDFVIVADDFNCYYDHGHYFHMEYDEQVQKAIPCENINLFEPVLGAMAISAAKDTEAEMKTPAIMKRGGIVVAITESHAVAREFTDALTRSAQQAAATTDATEAPLYVVDVPRFSSLEVEHVVSNFEATGIGRLRFDRGETVMDGQEVSYIDMVSGGVGQNLIDECVV